MYFNSMKKIFLFTVLISMIAAFGNEASAKAKYVFYFIGDGMGMGHVNTTQTYLRDIAHKDNLLMTTFPVAGQVMTYSASSPITDSAAAGTALSTGHKTRNSMVGMTPDSIPVYSIASDFIKAGYSVGVSTSVAGDDATPAAFYAHAPERGMKELISSQASGSGVAFFGAPVFKGMTGKDGVKTSWIKDMEDANYRVVYDYEGFRSISDNPEKVVMIASNPIGQQVGYTIDSIPNTISIKELTSASLAQMQRINAHEGFFMMVEGGNIDWAAHANDGGAVIKEIINFQEAIDVAYNFYLSHKDETLIVVTADHDTGGMALGRTDNRKNPKLSLVDYQKISKDRFSDFWKENLRNKHNVTWEEMKEFLSANLGFWNVVDITNEEEEALKEGFKQTFITHQAKDEKTLYNDFSRFSVIVYDIFNRHLGIGWTSSSHTANFVPVYAIGEGSEMFKGCIENTRIPELILQAAGIER